MEGSQARLLHAGYGPYNVGTGDGTWNYRSCGTDTRDGFQGISDGWSDTSVAITIPAHPGRTGYGTVKNAGKVTAADEIDHKGQ